MRRIKSHRTRKYVQRNNSHINSYKKKEKDESMK